MEHKVRTAKMQVRGLVVMVAAAALLIPHKVVAVVVVAVVPAQITMATMVAMAHPMAHPMAQAVTAGPAGPAALSQAPVLLMAATVVTAALVVVVDKVAMAPTVVQSQQQ
jgi:hypothetical protein